MTEQPQPPAPDRLPQTTLSGLARMATGLGSRPVDALISRLEGPGGPAWFAAALAASPMALHGPDLAPTPDRAVTLERLTGEKDRGKRLMKAGPGSAEFDRGVLLYLLSVAMARVLHGKVISSQHPSELEETLADLATALPAAWGNLCASQMR